MLIGPLQLQTQIALLSSSCLGKVQSSPQSIQMQFLVLFRFVLFRFGLTFLLRRSCHVNDITVYLGRQRGGEKGSPNRSLLHLFFSEW